LLLASLLAFGLTCGLIALRTGAERPIGASGFGLATLLALVGTGYALAALIAHLANVRPVSLGLLFFGLFGNALMTCIGALSVLLSVADFRRGRQIRRFGRVLLPPRMIPFQNASVRCGTQVCSWAKDRIQADIKKAW